LFSLYLLVDKVWSFHNVDRVYKELVATDRVRAVDEKMGFLDN